MRNRKETVLISHQFNFLKKLEILYLRLDERLRAARSRSCFISNNSAGEVSSCIPRIPLHLQIFLSLQNRLDPLFFDFIVIRDEVQYNRSRIQSYTHTRFLYITFRIGLRRFLSNIFRSSQHSQRCVHVSLPQYRIHLICLLLSAYEFL